MRWGKGCHRVSPSGLHVHDRYSGAFVDPSQCLHGNVYALGSLMPTCWQCNRGRGGKAWYNTIQQCALPSASTSPSAPSSAMTPPLPSTRGTPLPRSSCVSCRERLCEDTCKGPALEKEHYLHLVVQEPCMACGAMPGRTFRLSGVDREGSTRPYNPGSQGRLWLSKANTSPMHNTCDRFATRGRARWLLQDGHMCCALGNCLLTATACHGCRDGWSPHGPPC